ncbi:hypothetical protein [Bradyrhizobium elkanii]|uniref:hypothetical protein n=1 Tax=Bradyrhizobium elkanii TaxID=29448 RepID=UPI000409BD84|nr:hypothetical protein [Bradyrhizobium elkanii]
MEDEKTRLLTEAQRCRRLAGSINDPDGAAARLNALAEEYERRANDSQAAKDGKG